MAYALAQRIFALRQERTFGKVTPLNGLWRVLAAGPPLHETALASRNERRLRRL